MKYLDEYRDAGAAHQLAHEIRRVVTRPWTLMEICGGQTHAIVKFGIDALLPSGVTLIHGPGCPVCVTPVELIDKALEIAGRSEVTFCSFGDMLRVPGSKLDLLSVKAAGGDVRIVYNPVDAVKLAEKNPAKAGGFLRGGLRNNGAGHGHGGVCGRSKVLEELFPARVPRARAARDGGAVELA